MQGKLVKPVPPCGHGGGPRHDVRPSGEVAESGKFGQMFPSLPPLHEDLRLPPAEVNAKFAGLAAAMVDGAEGADNPDIPAGFTYFGQFVDHDITFDPTTIPEVLVDPKGLQNFRTPALELDSVYRAGPAVDRYMFEHTDPAKLRVGLTRRGGARPIRGGLPNDLLRLAVTQANGDDDPTLAMSGEAIIGDPRNDENLVLAQTHLAFVKFHNAVVDELRDRGVTGDIFNAARKETVWHYQSIVLHDFVARLCQPEVLRDVLHYGRKYYRPKQWAFIPTEFSVAAYRLGHSMVREDYDYNAVFGFQPDAVAPATLDLLFKFSHLSGADDPGPPPHQMPLPSDWIIDWRRFFDGLGGPVLNPTRALDPFLVKKLHNLPGTPPGEPASLAERNLKRGTVMGLPSGQRVAKAMAMPVLGDAELSSGGDGAALAAAGLVEHTPLWFYILKEAQRRGGGRRLGPVGSRIVAEVFVGLLETDEASFLAHNKKASGPRWWPSMYRGAPPDREHYTMEDMLRFVGDLNPIGD